MDFEKICTMFTMQEPFYGIILSSMERVPMPASRIDSIAVTRSGNVFRLIYNPEFAAQLDVPTTLEVLKHEIGHLCFNHFTLWDTEPKSNGEQHIRNIAADLEVNSYLNRSNIHGLHLYYPEDFDWDKGLGTKEYYRMLLDMLDKQQATASNQVTLPCNGGKGGQSNEEEANNNSGSADSGQQDENSENQQTDSSNTQKNESGNCDCENECEGCGESGMADGGSLEEASTGQSKSGGIPQSSGSSGTTPSVIPDDAFDTIEEFDDHSMWPTDKEQQETIKHIVEDMMISAADEVEKNGNGTLPGEMKGKIAEIRNRRKPKPAADWKRFVRRYLGNEFSEFLRKSKKRESRRFPDAAGNRHRRKSNILVAIDTSGSVSMPEYIEFFGQIRTLTSVASFDVIECDADIQKMYHFTGKPNMEVHGGGGTDFEPTIKFYIENKRKYDALIYFTDGECWVPSNTPKDTLWVISSRGDKDRANEFRVNGASVVFIPKKQG